MVHLSPPSILLILVVIQEKMNSIRNLILIHYHRAYVDPHPNFHHLLLNILICHNPANINNSTNNKTNININIIIIINNNSNSNINNNHTIRLTA